MTALALATTLLDGLRWIGIPLWLAVLLWLWRPTRRAFGRNPEFTDPLWAAIWILVLIRLGYQGTGLLFPTAPDTLAEAGWRVFLQVLSDATAVGVLWLKSWYRVRHRG